MKILSTLVFLALSLVSTISHAQEEVDYTAISFASEADFLITLESVVSLQVPPSNVEEIVAVFSGNSSQISPSNLEDLISALPVPAYDIVHTVNKLDILDSKSLTLQLQKAVLNSALTSISSGEGSEAIIPAAASLALLAIVGAVLDETTPKTVSLASSSSSIAENSGSTITLTATLSEPAGAAMTVSFLTSGAATEGSDYSTIPNITIAAGSTTGTASFTISDDAIYEGNEAAVVTISSISDAEFIKSGNDRVSITITDNESAPTISLASSSASIAENSGSTITLTATLSQIADEAVTVSFSTSGAATEGSDYSAIPNITIAAGSTTGTASFTISDDAIYEGNEVATVAVSSVSGADATENGSQSVSITVLENESAPTVSLASSSASIAENSASAITLTATLSQIADEAVTVSFSTSGVATSGTDYSSISNITIAAGSATGTTSFTPTNDAIYEGDEVATVAVSSVSGADATESGSQSVNITISEDDSAPTVSLASSSASIAESSASTITLTATLSIIADEAVTVTLSTSGAAVEGNDYAVISDITIAAGSSTGTTTFTPIDNAVYESSKVATVAVSSVSGANATENGNQSVSITLTEYENALTVTLSTSASSIQEDASGTITLTATLSELSDAAVTVALATSGSSAEGTDYANVPDITISAGSLTGTATFNPTNDNTYEGDETAIIAIDTVSGGSATESGTQSQTITINDTNDLPNVTLTVSGGSVAENGADLSVTATLSRVTSANVIVTLASSGTATSGSDYTALSTITITAGSTTAAVAFNPTDDSVYENGGVAETAIFDIQSVSGGSAVENATPQQITISITENESAPTVTLSRSASSIEEDAAGTITLTATLSVATTADVTVALATSGSSTEGTDYANVSDITISAGLLTGTVAFNPTDDNTYEGAETAIIAIDTVSGGSATESGTQSQTITINDTNDLPNVTLTVSGGSSASVAENGADLSVTATLSKATNANVIVTLASSGTATSGSDYAALSTITITAGSTTAAVAFNPTDDSVYENGGVAETVIFDISAVSGGSATESGAQQITISITENESAPTVTLSRSASSIEEDAAGTITLTATLSVATTADVTVALATSGSSTEGTDYANVSDITISAGLLTGTAAFNPTDDNTYEGAETAIIAIDTVSGGSATESGTQSQTITINDTNDLPNVTLTVSGGSSASVAESGADLSVTATLSKATNANVIVTLASSGTATSGSDYAALSTVTITAGSTSAAVAFNPTNDSVYENGGVAETAIFDISAVSGGSAVENSTPQQITISITENESAPTVTLSGSTTIDESTGAATITATIDQIVDENLTIGLSKSGTATVNTDYTVSNITILAMNTTGASQFNPVSDTDYEGGSEAAVLVINTITGMSGISSTGSVTITITNDALNSGTQLVENTTLSSTYKSSTEFTNFNKEFVGNYSQHSVQNPLEVINAHRAHGYGLMGDGIGVAVVDGYFDVDHSDLGTVDRSINSYGTIVDSSSAGGGHGTAVAGIIGAGYTGGSSDTLVGIAPKADLYLISFAANSTAIMINGINALPSSVKALNNSWGLNSSLIDEDKALMINNGWTAAQLVASKLGFSTTDASNWLDALNDFQDNGVVVFSNSNTASNDNAEIIGALPEIDSRLAEALILAVNINIMGTSGNETYTRKSAPCGDAASYCLGADGFGINTLNNNNSYKFHVYDSDNDSVVDSYNAGTSYVAPMVSGAVAIVAEAFPNQTPEQWTDRLLASANNSIGYTHIGATTFGNGVRHGYSHDAGHGILDIYAALQPITSSSYSQSIYAGSNNLSGQRYSLQQSSLISSQSFGDGLRNGLAGVRNYSFDALGGGFEYDMSQTVSVTEPSIPVINVQSELSKIRHLSDDLPKQQTARLAGVVADLGDSSKSLSLHFGSASAPVQMFYEFGSEGIQSELTYDAPYLSEKSGGVAVSVVQTLDKSRYMFGADMIVSDDADNTYGDHTALTIGVETQWTDVVGTGLLIGQSTQDDTFLGLSGSGAYGFEDAAAKSNFVGGKIVFDTSLSSRLSLTGLMGKSDLNTNNYSLLTGANGVSSSSLAVTFEKFNLFDKDHLSISLSQPNRVESGSLGVKLTNLSNSNGDLSYNETIVSLKPSGRQLDLGLTYESTVSKNTTIKAKVVATHDKNHVANTENVYSSFIGINLGDWSIGAAVASDTSPTEARASYSTSF